MKVKKMNYKIEKGVELYLEDHSLEDFFEMFDVTPDEVVEVVYEAGLLSDYLLRKLIPADA